MILVVAEKFSQAMSYYFALTDVVIDGKEYTYRDFENDSKMFSNMFNKDGYVDVNFEGNDYRITWAAGHFYGLKHAQDYVEDYKNWRKMPTPWIPERYEIKSTVDKKFKSTERQRGIVHRLFKEADYVINGCDPDQEGSLIFGYIKEWAGADDIEYKRLIINSLEEDEIQRGFRELASAEEDLLMENAGRVRAITDFIIGVNFTKDMTLNVGSVLGDNGLVSVGRVQTPVLNWIVERELEIRNFVSTPFYEIVGHFEGSGETFDAKSVIGRIEEKERAEALKKALEEYDEGIVKELKQKKTRERVPQLHNTTSFQGLMNSKHKIPLAETTKILQSLYEKKLISYPRTDARSLPMDMIDNFNQSLNQLAAADKRYADLLAGGEIKDEYAKHHFSEKFQDSHYALITTPARADIQSLSADEKIAYNEIALSMIAVTYGPAVALESELVIEVGDEYEFKTKGKVMVDRQWQEVLNVDRKDREIPNVEEGDLLKINEIEIAEGKTTPPKRYNTKAILDKMVATDPADDNPDLDNERVEVGLGRPSTRDKIVENVISRYCTINKSGIITPTERGIEMIRVLPVEEIKTTEFNTILETNLDKIRLGEMGVEESLEIVHDNLRKWTKEISKISVEDVNIEALSEDNLFCPVCKKPMKEFDKAYLCSGNRKTNGTCEFFLPKTIAKKKLSKKNVEDLLAKGKTGKIKGFTSNKGNKFDAELEIKDGRVSFFFPEPDSLENPCPKCGGKVRVFDKAYVCENNRRDNGSCDFFMTRFMSGKQIPKAEAEKLVKGEVTKEIKGMVSKAGNTYSARFVLDDDKRMTFYQEKPKELDVACPLCGGKVINKGKTVACEHNVYKGDGCEFFLMKNINGVDLSEKNIEDLIKDGITSEVIYGMSFTIKSKTYKPTGYLMFDERSDYKWTTVLPVGQEIEIDGIKAKWEVYKNEQKK